MRRTTKHRLISLLPLAFALMVAFVAADQLASARRNSVSRSTKHENNPKAYGTQEPAPAMPKSTPVTGPPPASTPTPPPDATKIRKLGEEKKTAQLQVLSAGTLTGRMFVPTPPTPVNLTSGGTLDWTHWGHLGADVFDHKVGVVQQISNYTLVGTSQVFWFNNNPTGFTWTDGTPHLTVTNGTTGVFTIGIGTGFQVTVPADTNLKTLRIYLGAWSARGRFEASLSDGSAPIFLDTALINQSATTNAVYTIGFAAGSAGQTLTIKYTVETMYNGSGNVTLEGMTLVSGGDPDVPPVVNISAPTDEATFNAGDTINVNANAFDTDGSIAAVDFYADGFPLGTGTLSGSNQYSLSWNSAFAGTHTLTAVATDNEGAKTTSAPINLTALPTFGGTLAARMSSPNPPSAINLTTDGPVDWVHWGNGGPQVVDRKSGVPPLISNISVLGTSAPAWLADNPTFFNWTDGAPTVSATNNRTGIFVSSAGNGFEISVPADTTFRTVRLYTGFW
jgi:hypothetical protein